MEKIVRSPIFRSFKESELALGQFGLRILRAGQEKQDGPLSSGLLHTLSKGRRDQHTLFQSRDPGALTLVRRYAVLPLLDGTVRQEEPITNFGQLLAVAINPEPMGHARNPWRGVRLGLSTSAPHLVDTTGL